MPILHRYQDKNGYFVKTSIKNLIITYQLSSEGAQRLFEAGVKIGVKFRRALLYELYRSGDAYTHGSGPGILDTPNNDQFDLDFKNDPEPDSMFPQCSLCSSLDDLHLVEIREEHKRFLGLYCPKCHEKNNNLVLTSIPIWIVTKGIFEQLALLKEINDVDKNVATFKEYLDQSAKKKWEELFDQKKRDIEPVQPPLFTTEEKQRKLI